MVQIYPQPEVEPRQNPQKISIVSVGNTSNTNNVTPSEPATNLYNNTGPFVIDIQPARNPSTHVTYPGDYMENTDEDICRICHGNGDNEKLVRVCRCKGSTKYAHKSCVLQWFKTSYRFECELCKYKMKIKKDGLKPFKEWSIPCDLASFLNFFAFFTVHALHGILLLLIIMIAVMKKCFTVMCIFLILICLGITLLTYIYCDGCDLFKYCKLQWTVKNSRWSISTYDEELELSHHGQLRSRDVTSGSIHTNGETCF